MGQAAAEDAGGLESDMVAELCAGVGGGLSVRRKLPFGGRLHVDRPLPFIAIHRGADSRRASAARGVATASPVYAIWPCEPDADAFGYDLIEGLAATLESSLGRFLGVELHDLPTPETDVPDSPEPTPYRFRIGASDDPLARQVAARLREALLKLELERRTPDVEVAADDPGEANLPAGLPRLSLGIPRAYRKPDGDGVFPGVLHALETGVLDALLQALCAVVEESSLDPPAHYRGLGRRGFIQAARHADRKLAEVASSFNFLLAVSPINTAPAWETFRRSGFSEAPVFHYRPLPIDPSTAKRALYAIDIDGVEDPVLETLFREKQQEIDLQLTMLQSRETPRFRDASVMLYGRVDDRLAGQAEAVLAALADPRAPADDVEDGPEPVDCHEVRDAANALVARYRKVWPGFKADISIRDDVAGLMVSGPRLMISRQTRMRRARLNPLLQHEVSVHLLTYFTGSGQGLKIFRSGLAGYEGIQEGLGVFAEFAAGGLTAARLRLLAARVLAVRAMVDGADFMEAFRLLRDDRSVPARAAFQVCARVFRSGGFAKDFIYLRGLMDVLDYLAGGRSLEPFWFGKIALGHAPVIDELNERGFLTKPSLQPEFLTEDWARPQLARARAGVSLADLLNESASV